MDLVRSYARMRSFSDRPIKARHLEVAREKMTAAGERFDGSVTVMRRQVFLYFRVVSL